MTRRSLWLCCSIRCDTLDYLLEILTSNLTLYPFSSSCFAWVDLGLSLQDPTSRRFYTGPSHLPRVIEDGVLDRAFILPCL